MALVTYYFKAAAKDFNIFFEQMTKNRATLSATSRH